MGPAQGEPVAQDRLYLMPKGAGQLVSPPHLQHLQVAAHGCHLNPSQHVPTSSHLLLPDHSHQPGCGHVVPTYVPPVLCQCWFIFAFSGSSAPVSSSSGLEDKVYPHAALHLPGGAGLSQGGQLCPCIACVPCPCGKVIRPMLRQWQLPRVNPSVNPRGPCQPDVAILGEASPDASSPWEPSSPNQAQDKPALAALSATTSPALARPQGQGEE